MTNEIKTNSAPPVPSELPDDKALPKLTFDPDKYRDKISEYADNEEQQNQMMEALWNIMSMMVDLGWGVDSVQMLLPDLFENAGADSGKLIEQSKSQTFNLAVENDFNEKEKNND